MKKIGYLVFASFYYIFCMCPVKKNKVFYIMTHDSSKGSNVGVMIERLKEEGNYKFHGIAKEETKIIKGKLDQTGFGRFLDKLLHCILFFTRKPYNLATSSIILQDNVFMPMAYIKFRKSVKVIQLWHGTGTIKKFGQSVNIGQVAKMEKNANETITHLIVNSELSKIQSKEAFGVEENRIKVLGLPRTDMFFDDDKKEWILNEFYGVYPQLKNKKIMLYAPTFRDEEIATPKVELDISYLLEHTPKDYVLALKLHPFVAHSFIMDTDSTYQDRIINVSNYHDINGLMLASYLLITDYSSIIFEYCLLQKPMIFFAYDLDYFTKDGRGFYENYEEYVPGPIVYSTQDLVAYLQKGEFDIKRGYQFMIENYKHTDGKATERILDILK